MNGDGFSFVCFWYASKSYEIECMWKTSLCNLVIYSMLFPVNSLLMKIVIQTYSSIRCLTFVLRQTENLAKHQIHNVLANDIIMWCTSKSYAASYAWKVPTSLLLSLTTELYNMWTQLCSNLFQICGNSLHKQLHFLNW